MSSDPKNYFGFLVDEISERGHAMEWVGANRILNIHFTNSDWKPHLNLLKVFDVSLEMSGDPKNYFGFNLHKTNLPSSCIASHRLLVVSVISGCRSWSQIDLMPSSQKCSPNSDNLVPRAFPLTFKRKVLGTRLRIPTEILNQTYEKVFNIS